VKALDMQIFAQLLPVLIPLIGPNALPPAYQAVL